MFSEKMKTMDLLPREKMGRHIWRRDKLKSFAKLTCRFFVFSWLIGLSIPAYATLNFTFNAEDEGSRPGEAFQVEWIVSNDGAVQENNVSVELPFPASGINSLSESLSDGGACPSITCDVGETIIWSLGNIPAGESRIASFALVVANGTVDGTINIEARLLQGSSVVATSGWGQQVQLALAAELAIDSSLALVVPGETFSFGVVAGNRGTNALTNATLSVPVPAGLTIDSAPGGSISGNMVTWNLGNLPSGRVTRRVVNVQVLSNVGVGELIVLNDATLSGDIFGLPQSTTADQVVTVGSSMVELQIRAQETQFRPGESQNIEIIVSNSGSTTFQNGVVTFLYPHNLSSISDSQTLGGDCPSITCTSGEHMTWNLANLLPGETVQLRFSTAASSGSGGGFPVKWQGRLRSGSNIISREYLATGNSSVDVNLQIDSDETHVAAGEIYNYTFNIGNTGIDSINSALLTVPVPEEVTVLDTFDGTLSSGTVSWSLSDLASGSVMQKTLRVQADNNLPNGKIINLIDAQLSATVFGLPQATMAQHFLSIEDRNLDMEVRLQQAVATSGESVLLEIVVSNSGSQVEQNVIAGLLFPDDTNSASVANLEGVSCASITCDSGEQVSVAFGNLVPGETKSVAYSVSADSNALLGEHATWIGTVFSDNSAARRVEATLGISQVGLELQPIAEQLLVGSGDTIAYQFASGNTSGFIIGQASLSVPVPAETSVVSSPGGVLIGNRVIYDLGDIEDEEIHLRELQLTVSGGTSNGTQIPLENIELSGVLFGVEQSTYAGHVVAVGSSPLVGSISVLPTDPQPDELVEVTIQIQNDSGAVQQNVAARLRYPAGVDSVSQSLMDGGVCPSITCDSGEDVVWSLGTLTPGASVTVSFSARISDNEPVGAVIEWAAKIQAGTTNQRRIEASSLVGSVVGPPVVPTDLCNGLPVTVDLNLGQTTTPASDVVMGTPGNDDIRGKAGDDTICGMGGDDFIHGNSGNDWIDGGDGIDNIRGGQGSDVLFSGNGATVGTSSRVFGGTGDDAIFGGPDADDLRGGRGDDAISGEQGADLISGNEDDDLLYGGPGADTLKGGNGENDELFGEGGNDSLNGGSGGNDFCDGGGQGGDTDSNCEVF